MLVPAAQAAAADFPLTLETEEGSGSGTIECEVEGSAAEPCDPEYPEGTEISFLATPDTGSEFAEWGGDCLGFGDDCELTIKEPTVVSALFEAEEVPLEVVTEGTGLGEIECKVELGPAEPCEAEYPYGTEIALVAEPDSESEFVEWDGDCSGTGGCVVTMDEEHYVSAFFDVLHYPLEVELAGSGKGTVTSSPAGIDCGSECEAPFEAGETVTLTAQPASNSTFSGWSGPCSGTGGCVVTMSAARGVTATFTAEPTPPPPGSGTGTGTAVVAAKAKVKGGKVLLKLTCKGEGACKGSLKLMAKIKVGNKTKNKVIGKASFSIVKGGKKTVKVKLSGPAKQTLAKKKTLKAKVEGKGVRSRTVKLKK